MAAGGNKQCGTIDKQDASSPTTALEYVLRTAVIDAKERREVAVIDIPNAFVQTHLECKEDKVCRAHGESGSQNLYEVCHYQHQRRDCDICPSPQCSLWHCESCSSVLPTLCHQLEINWF
jgi:hypothetical protein